MTNLTHGKGPLVVVVWDDGWPGGLIAKAFNGRAYTKVIYEHQTVQHIGFEYQLVDLPGRFKVQLPSAVICDKAGALIADRTKLFAEQKASLYKATELKPKTKQPDFMRAYADALVTEIESSMATAPTITRASWKLKQQIFNSSSNMSTDEQIIE
ncbi:MAG: hypothetical protein IPP40_09490 [bacterium]|nr:hypothetical protein [bacterium]